MTLIPYEPSMIDGIARCYNDNMAVVSRFRPIEASRFAVREVLLPPHVRVRDEQIMVAREGRDIVGFIHVGIARPPEEADSIPGEPGVIRHLCYQPGCHRAGQALLEWAEAYFRQHDRKEILSWHIAHRYFFGMGVCPNLSEKIAHVWALHTVNGYHEEGSHIDFEWPDFVPPVLARPALDFEIRMEWSGGPAYDPMDVCDIFAYQGETQLGQCTMARLPVDPEWGHCDFMRVEPPYRGRRLGWYLLALGLEEMRKLGCRHAIVNTHFDNPRAILCYTNFGFRFAHRAAHFRKQLVAAR